MNFCITLILTIIQYLLAIDPCNTQNNLTKKIFFTFTKTQFFFKIFFNIR